jgi:hypothetical protein
MKIEIHEFDLEEIYLMRKRVSEKRRGIFLGIIRHPSNLILGQ